jgi:hypothetical protein
MMRGCSGWVRSAQIKFFSTSMVRDNLSVRMVGYLKISSSGGGFVLGLPAPAPLFWRYIQENLDKRGKPTGLAILNYSELDP